MRISDEALDEFIAICREEFNITHTKSEAAEKALRFLLFYRLIYRPLPSEIETRQQQLAARPSSEAHPDAHGQAGL
jgi:hypothetical protein